MELTTPQEDHSASAPGASRPIHLIVPLLGVALGGLTTGALWALRPEVCSSFCSVHAFLALTLVVTFGLHAVLGRQEGTRAGTCFALSFGFGVMLCALVVSAARIAGQGDDIMIEPLTRQHVIDTRPPVA
jgi:hypothetical protein